MANGRTRLIIGELPKGTKGKKMTDEIFRALNQSETAATYNRSQEKEPKKHDNSK